MVKVWFKLGNGAKFSRGSGYLSFAFTGDETGQKIRPSHIYMDNDSFQKKYVEVS